MKKKKPVKEKTQLLIVAEGGNIMYMSQHGKEISNLEVFVFDHDEMREAFSQEETLAIAKKPWRPGKNSKRTAQAEINRIFKLDYSDIETKKENK